MNRGEDHPMGRPRGEKINGAVDEVEMSVRLALRPVGRTIFTLRRDGSKGIRIAILSLPCTRSR
jgi:hypothetical protein